MEISPLRAPIATAPNASLWPARNGVRIGASHRRGNSGLRCAPFGSPLRIRSEGRAHGEAEVSAPRDHDARQRQRPPHPGRERRMARGRREEQHHSDFHRMAGEADTGERSAGSGARKGSTRSGATGSATRGDAAGRKGTTGADLRSAGRKGNDGGSRPASRQIPPDRSEPRLFYGAFGRGYELIELGHR